ncbi:MAG: hypothetical protein JWQ34_2391 [Mucilaginibacter sp.]|nr:hypothetical protein [Mucilaginibacter sp.]
MLLMGLKHVYSRLILFRGHLCSRFFFLASKKESALFNNYCTVIGHFIVKVFGKA